ncbi:MAG: aminotransferase class I/II-fold pyridoxal phosphate-dependent enzyme [Candidatus Gastranaerophilales bacterium]|nr:aminotransferase class I/II-fold pyridoxal phosphate-dependent enzyme [Candidatus Gastranaerophilales bacterium]
MKELFNDYVKSMTTYIMFQIKVAANKLKPELEAKGRSPIFLSMGAPTENPPEYMIDKLKEALDKDGVHTYSTPRGEKYLLDAIAERMRIRFGVELDPEKEIASLLGSKEGLAHFIRILITPSLDETEQDVIFIPDPGYASYAQMISIAGGKPVSVPLTQENNFMPDMNEIWENYLEQGGKPEKAKALIINYPNNPLGATATREYYEHVIEFCKKHQIMLMSDAAYSDLYFNEDDKPFSVLEFEGAKDIAVEFYSFSKPYAMTGARAGWVCGNAEGIAQLCVLKSTIDNGIYKPIQMAAAAILNSREGEEYYKKANLELKRKQEIFVQGMKELGWPDFYVPNATFYLWMPIPPRYSTSKEFTDNLMKVSGIIAVPGHAYGSHGEGFFRVSVVCSEEQIYECIKRMKKDGFTYEK